MVRGVVLGVVYPKHHRDVLTLCRGGNDHLLGTCVKMLLSIRAVRAYASRFDDEINPSSTPVEF